MPQLTDRKEFNESKPLPVAESSVKQEQQSESDLPGSAPIYITIPIYINTSKLTPIRLTIGDQKFRSAAMRRKQSTKSPNSHFNRLLEPAKRRSSNRHRSPIASQIEAIEEPMASSTLKTNATAASN
ncbi:uncharacterized protein LOC117134780 [Drosophila busckii]|uniref:uncharacterized protein LOC117134780 n=1 Tax=Drosophila busckii TaxID=30019 RepID=UPI001433451C|nr:uncharacterized protein LOC117134780 [Drosophila busckii]